VSALRNYLYDKGILDVHDAGVLTISVGNITTGGTGKTPLVAYIADVLAESGHEVGILTRGYGRRDESERVLVSDGYQILADPSAAGDEPIELAQKLLGKAVVIADADRSAAAEWARRRFGITAFVLDDAFQHRKVRRDLNIVCIDATDPFGGGDLLPVGRLREKAAGLGRADAIVITRAEQAGDLSGVREQIKSLAPNAKLFTSKTRLTSLRSSKDDSTALPNQERPVFAFSGIGNPSSFERLLKGAGFNIAGAKHFPDHHIYTAEEIADIESTARSKNAGALVTTAKDAVKLRGTEFSLPCYVAEVALEFDDASEFRDMVRKSRR